MRFLVFLFGMVLISGGIWWWLGKEPSQSFVMKQTTPAADVTSNSGQPSEPVLEEKSGESQSSIVQLSITTVKRTVPFTSQAPTGEWGKSAFQDGCEEASTLMVWMARNDKKLTPQGVKEKLLALASFQEKQLGHGVDTNVHDTHEHLLKEYFGITDAREVYDITLDVLKQAVMEGLVIVPTNGRELGNPNFTAPGPLQHMLVIVGYDSQKKEFITNDPGTRKGEGYRYSEAVLYSAIREYPTGKHLPITTERKSMLVIPFDTVSQE